MKKIYDFVKLIAITMISWKISKSVIEFFNNLSQESFSKNFEKTMGLTILFTSLMYNIDAISKQLRNGPDLAINIQGITSSIGLGMSTYMMTKNLTLTLLVTAIDLVFQAGVSINKLWEEMKPYIEENGGIWNTWKKGMHLILDDVGTKLGNFFVNPFINLHNAIIESGGYWEMWKQGAKSIITNIGETLGGFFIDPFKNLHIEIMNNGGYWETWKQGAKCIITNVGETLGSFFIDPFENLHTEIMNNGGYWETWKRGVKVIIDDIKDWLTGLKEKINSSVSSFSRLKTEIDNNGGIFQSWLKGINVIFEKKENGGVFSNGSWRNIAKYADGGIPSHGSMFVAGEHGAEIVGHINGRTEVLNQSQIASAIYSAVVSAMSQYEKKSTEIEVYVHTDEGTVIDRIEQKTKQTGVFPFAIPI